MLVILKIEEEIMKITRRYDESTIKYTAPDKTKIIEYGKKTAMDTTLLVMEHGLLSAPGRHITLQEQWFVVKGHGMAFLRYKEYEAKIELEPGMIVQIPAGGTFQFFNTSGKEDLMGIIVGSETWPGPQEWIDADKCEDWNKKYETDPKAFGRDFFNVGYLPVDCDYQSAFGEEYRLLISSAETNVQHVTLPVGVVSPVRYYDNGVEHHLDILSGTGKLWYQDKEGMKKVIDLHPEMEVLIEPGEHVQYASTGSEPLVMLMADNAGAKKTLSLPKEIIPSSGPGSSVYSLGKWAPTFVNAQSKEDRTNELALKQSEIKKLMSDFALGSAGFRKVSQLENTGSKPIQAKA